MTDSNAFGNRVLDLAHALLNRLTEGLGQYHPAVGKALVHMANNLQAQLSVEDLARTAYVSGPHLTRLFRWELGLSPMQFLALLRVEQSKQLLRDGWRTMTKVCEESGFADLRAFERTFKKCVGCTPREYQKAVREQARSSRAEPIV